MKKELLFNLLADFQVLYFDAYNLHWNVEGPFFKPIHDFAASIYGSAQANADRIAERIRQLGNPIPTSMGNFLSNKTIVGGNGPLTDPTKGLKLLETDYTNIISHLVEICSQCEDDIATDNMMADMAESMEKELWMIRMQIK